MDITVSFYTSSSEEAENLARSAEDPASENREHGETDQLWFLTSNCTVVFPHTDMHTWTPYACTCKIIDSDDKDFCVFSRCESPHISL